MNPIKVLFEDRNNVIRERLVRSFETKKGYMVIVYKKPGDDGYREGRELSFLNIEFPLEGREVFVPELRLLSKPPGKEKFKLGRYLGTDFRRIKDSYPEFYKDMDKTLESISKNLRHYEKNMQPLRREHL